MKEVILTKYFTLRPVDQYGSVYVGYREPKVFTLTEDIHFSEQDTIGIFWSPEGLESIHENSEKPKNAGSTGEKKEEAVSLEECINLFTKTEKLGPEDPWYCNKCKEFQQATKKFDIWSLPKILIIHLKRFSYRNKWHREKLETLVDFPFENLDMSKYLLSNPSEPQIYDLYAISNHYGALGGGHYTAYCLQDRNWYKFDDSHVSEISTPSIKTSAAYVLFYQRRQTEEEKKRDDQALRTRFAEIQEEIRRKEEEARREEEERLKELEVFERERTTQREARDSDEQEPDDEKDSSGESDEERVETKVSNEGQSPASSGRANGESEQMDTDW